jgi:hypothetical protein
MRCVSMPESLGRLQRYDASGPVVRLGVALRDEQPDSYIAVMALADPWAQQLDIRDRVLEGPEY